MSDSGELCLLPGVMGLREVLSYSEPGTHQFRKADYPWLARVRVRVQAAGGGSAGAVAADNEAVSRPGGAGGGYSESLLDVTALGDVESVIVGAGGAAGVGNNAGSAGGASSFGGLVSAVGGDGSLANMASGAAPTTASGVPAPYAGVGQLRMGGGGGGAGFRLSRSRAVAGQGGDSHLGHGGFQRSSSGQGTSPRGFGAGAGGACSIDGEEWDGTDGGGGLVVVELFG